MHAWCTRMYSSRICTARSLLYGGFLPNRDPPGQRSPRQRPPWIETTPLDRDIPDRDPLDRDPLLDRDSPTETPWTETPLDRDLPRQRPPPLTETHWTEIPLDRDPQAETPWTETPRSCDLWCMLGQRPPCEQNQRRLWKHNLAATSLRAVKKPVNIVSKIICLGNVLLQFFAVL